jgi:hypothetical protein
MTIQNTEDWIKKSQYNYYNGTPSGDFLRPHTFSVVDGLQEPPLQTNLLNLAPGSTWQPSFL